MRRALLALTAALAACSTPDPAMQAASSQPLTCANRAECDLYWQRAQVWVGSHAGYKVQIANEAIIQTFGPMGQSPDLAFQLARVPNADGSATINAAANCDNIFGCLPSAVESVAALKAYVRAGR